jgi:uncharacterized protein YkwD
MIKFASASRSVSRRNIWFSLPILTLVAFASAAELQAQQLYSIGSPTNEEQFMLELINRARADGGAEAARLGLSNLNEGPPTLGGEVWTILNSVQPLSWNPKLQNAAQGQADILNNGDQFFSGQDPHRYPNGTSSPDARIKAAGYSAADYNGRTTPSGFIPGPENVAEQVSQGSGPFTGARIAEAVVTGHTGLFVDQTVPSRGHRSTMMLEFFREIGIGITSGTDNGQGATWDSIYIVQDYGTEKNSTPFITGVIYTDANGNNFYDPGEGVSGIRVDVTGANFFAVSSSSGGYSVPVPGNGSYTVTFSGGSLPSVQRSATVSGGANVKLDYVAAATAQPTVLGNISTRLRVETGENVLIGGFIVTGTQGKKIIVRAIGPSLPFADRLLDPTLELHDSSGALLQSNDDWRTNQQAEIIATTIPPSNDLESAIVRTVPPGAYTAIVRGVNNSTGVGLVEVYDLDRSVDSKLANISTRGLVQTGDNVMIGGTIVLGQSPQKVIVRAIGPSLAGVSGRLADPTLELRDGNGGLLAANDDWRTGGQEAEIQASTVPPSDGLESAIVGTLNPGNYTAIVRGVNNTTGVGLVEVYALNN